MGDNASFFDGKNFVREILSGEIPIPHLLNAGARLGAFMGATVGFAGHLSLALALDRGRDPQIGGLFTQRWSKTGCRIFRVRRTVTGKVPIGPEWEQRWGKGHGTLLICNHRSYADVPVVGAELPVVFIGAAEVLKWPIIGSGTQMAGHILVDRSDKNSRHRVRDAVMDRLHKGLNVLNYPEGVCNLDPGLLPFNPGLFRSMAGLPVPLVPVTLYYPPELGIEWRRGMEKGFVEHLLEKVNQDIRAKVHFGDAIDCGAIPDAEELMELVRTRMLEALEMQRHSPWT